MTDIELLQAKVNRLERALFARKSRRGPKKKVQPIDLDIQKHFKVKTKKQ